MNKINGIVLFRLCFCMIILCFCNGCGANESVLYMESGNESGLESVCLEDETEQTGIAEKETDVEMASIEQTMIFVHVCGAVNSPGVYELRAGARVTDAVEAAGGVTQDADSEYVNLAEVLSDGVKVRIPTAREVESALENGEPVDSFVGIVSAKTTSFSNEDTKKVNINTAGIEELCTLPGIGETRAASILDYRQTYGNFSQIEDIMQVSGIKENSFQKIKDMITVN